MNLEHFLGSLKCFRSDIPLPGTAHGLGSSLQQLQGIQTRASSCVRLGTRQTGMRHQQGIRRHNEYKAHIKGTGTHKLFTGASTPELRQ